MSGFIDDQRGAVAVWALLIMASLLLAWTGTVRITQEVTASDVDLQRAVQEAARAAAYQVTPESQASGSPRIGEAAARAAFEQKLRENLGLGANLAPLPGTALARAPRYSLAVYNGSAGYGATAGKRYDFDGVIVTETSLSASGFPVRFGITGVAVQQGTSGTITAELPTPGVVAVVEATLNAAVGRDPMVVTRWSSARVVWTGWRW